MNKKTKELIHWNVQYEGGTQQDAENIIYDLEQADRELKKKDN